MQVTKIIAFMVVGQMIFLLAAETALAVQGGDLRYYSTRHAIGIEWDVTGDDDHNSQCLVFYRKSGSGGGWTEALSLFRVDFKAYDMVAGSILSLEPGTDYEVRLELSDSGGGDSVETFTASTLALPAPPSSGRTLYAVPGSGGGSGTAANPFRGIAAANADVVPGDTVLLGTGTYAGESEFTTSGAAGRYIVWKARGDGRTVVETIRVNGDHLWFEGLDIEGNQYGVRTYDNPRDIVVINNRFSGCHYCVYLNHGGTAWYIADNVIVGDVDPSSGDFDGEGIELQHSDDHTVSYNSISKVADGISYPGRNCDIFGNEIFDVSDDGIEPDYGTVNNRIHHNRISNALHNGISFQPMNGAPWYILRNQVAAPLESALKFRDDVDRALIAHNTFVGWQGAQKSGSSFLLAVQSNNNLWISMTDWYAWENDAGGTSDWRTSLDYDGFDWGNHPYAVKWGERYSNLAAFSQATGLEPHGVRIDKSSCFATLSVPQPPPASMPRQYITLKPACNGVDAGIVLAGINEDYAGTAPDLGAYEVGRPLPHFGPRTSYPPPSPPPSPSPSGGSVIAPLSPLLLND